jgi:uncharacterized protein YcfL
MKCLFTLVVMLFVGFTASAQTNVVNIYNSKVTINNITVIQTNVVQSSVSSTNKTVVLPIEVVERLRWEAMLEQRRVVLFRSYLRRYDK